VSIRAKFYVAELTLLPGYANTTKIALAAVVRGDHNASWAAATPVGRLEMTINNPAAGKWFEDFLKAARTTGRSPEVYLDIAPVEDGWPGDGHKFRMADVPPGHYQSGRCGDCGEPKDGELFELNDLGCAVKTDKPAHPNG
jgi:hypothetical protein